MKLMLKQLKLTKIMMENTIIKAVKTEEQYRAVMQQIKALWDCPENSPEADLLEVLAILADDYENKVCPIAPLDPIEAIKYEMEENGLTPKDLSPFLGSRSRVSEVLNRKRPLTFMMAKKLFKGLNIPAETLLAY
jgi:HTH-type transcriptional regulator / antitoxin HigA